jgi:NAD(P)-dependent dehydrogenase (short-subunit alcohol dehydrogenase family)
MDNPFSLRNKTIFVTGASSGIGQTTAIEASRLGADLVITGRNEQNLQKTYSQLSGQNHTQFTADLSETEKFDELADLLPELDGFVCNAGINKKKPIKFINQKDLRDQIEINTITPVLLTKSLVRKRKLKNPSSIVFVSSISGLFNATVGNSMYAASKGGLHGFMKTAAIELASRNIRCNSVNPGLVDTPMLGNIKSSKEELKNSIQKYPLGRLGQPEDVAYAIIYFLSDASSWVTGSSLVIDGGKTL